jgi:biotin-(acetyl-CoA carboxylase) ligase
MRTVVGIGINVAQEDFPAEVAAIATSLKRLGVLADVERITTTVMEEFCLLLDQPLTALLREWRQRLAIEGRSVQVLGSQEQWEAVEIRDDGRLILRNTANGEQIAVDSADSVRYRLGNF